MASAPPQDPTDPGPQVSFDQELSALQKLISHTEKALKAAPSHSASQELGAKLKQLKHMQFQMTSGAVDRTMQDLIQRAPGAQQPDPAGGQMIQSVLQGGFGQ